MRIQQKRGSMIAMVIILSVVLLLLLNSVLSLTGSAAYQAQSMEQASQARYAAESVVSTVHQHLLNDIEWRAGMVNATMPGGKATVNVRFGPGPDGSVNNLSGADAADGPRGPGTVAAHTVDLVIKVSVGNTAKRYEVVLNRSARDVAPFGVSASGNVTMLGSTTIAGVADLNAHSPSIPAGIESYNTNGGDGTIVWDMAHHTSDTLDVSGKVVSTSNATNAIQLNRNGNSVTTGGEENNASPLLPFNPDIRAKVTNNVSNLMATNPQADMSDKMLWNTTVNGYKIDPGGLNPARSYYYNGDLVVDSDLYLTGTTLFINGTLTVQGGVQGRGSVYVNGRAVIRGGSRTAARDPKDHTSLYVQGNIILGAAMTSSTDVGEVFYGNIFTRGSLACFNNFFIKGGAWAASDGSNLSINFPYTNPYTGLSRTLTTHPGDIVFGAGSGVLWVESTSKNMQGEFTPGYTQTTSFREL